MPSKSKSQQKFFGYVYSILNKKDYKNSKEYKEASKEVKKTIDSIPKKDAKDFASTKHKGLPEEVKKDKKNESSIITKFDEYIQINEHRFNKGYPVHLDNPKTIAGIEEEEFNTIIIVEDENGFQYAVEEEMIDEFLEDNPNFVSTIVHPPIVVTISKYGYDKEFNRETDMVKFIDGEWVFPDVEIFVGE
jgi:hypothetical protein